MPCRAVAGGKGRVIPDRSPVGFMYSYPNLIPLPPDTVEAIAAALGRVKYEAIYGAWWGRLIPADAKDVVERSAERYVRAARDGAEPKAAARTGR